MTTEEVRRAQRKLDKAARKLRAAQEEAADAARRARDDAKPLEPRPSQETRVVTFTKRFTPGGKAYSYSALRPGIAQPWYLSGTSRTARGPYTWAQLLDFIAPPRDKEPAKAWATIREHVAVTTPLRTQGSNHLSASAAVGIEGPLLPHPGVSYPYE